MEIGHDPTILADGRDKRRVTTDIECVKEIGAWCIPSMTPKKP